MGVPQAQEVLAGPEDQVGLGGKAAVVPFTAEEVVRVKTAQTDC
jgi:hypothetical protein